MLYLSTEVVVTCGDREVCPTIDPAAYVRLSLQNTSGLGAPCSLAALSATSLLILSEDDGLSLLIKYWLVVYLMHNRQEARSCL